MPKLLFICSKNKWRSPTAELLFKNHPAHLAKSAGTTDNARIKINRKLIDWADIVFVMENKHRGILNREFRQLIGNKQVIVLDIDDNYQFNDPELVDILRLSLKEYL